MILACPRCGLVPPEGFASETAHPTCGPRPDVVARLAELLLAHELEAQRLIGVIRTTGALPMDEAAAHDALERTRLYAMAEATNAEAEAARAMVNATGTARA